MKLSFFYSLCVPLALGAVLMGGCSAADNDNLDKAPHVMKRSIDMAEDINTNNNISQINMALGMYKNDNEGKAPATLEEAQTVSYKNGCNKDMWTDKTTGKTLNYDPATGTVSQPKP